MVGRPSILKQKEIYGDFFGLISHDLVLILIFVHIQSIVPTDPSNKRRFFCSILPMVILLSCSLFAVSFFLTVGFNQVIFFICYHSLLCTEELTCHCQIKQIFFFKYIVYWYVLRRSVALPNQY
jgi:hypothetical protein